MEYQVVNLVIAVYWMTPIFWLLFFEEFEHFIEVWYRSYSFVCLDVHCFCLCIANRGERSYLTVIKSTRLAKALEADILWVDSV